MTPLRLIGYYNTTVGIASLPPFDFSSNTEIEVVCFRVSYKAHTIVGVPSSTVSIRGPLKSTDSITGSEIK